jgi:hypothetical protein
MSEVPYDPSDRRHVKIAQKAAKQSERARTDYTKHIMASENGRAWMLDLLTTSHIFACSHSGNALQTAFNEGERNVGLQILNLIMQACPDHYVTMMQERNARESANDARRANVPDTDDDEPAADLVEPADIEG